MLNVVCVGAGWVVNARHIPALKKSGRCRVIGIVDKNPARAAASAKTHGLPHHGDSLDVDWAQAADAFTVGVSPMDHFAVVGRLLETNKQVLMEKPMCLTVAEGERLVEKAKARSRVLAIVHNFQFARSVLKAKRIVEKGKWGKITALHGFQWSSPQRRLPHWYEQLPLGLFFDESPHLLYLLRAFGTTSECCPTKSPVGQHSDVVRLRKASMIPSTLGKSTPAILNIELDAGGIPATLFMNFEAPISEWQLMVLCEKGALVIDIFRDILVKIPTDRAHGARDIVRSSRKLLGGHLWGFFTSGIRLLTGRLQYGNDEVVKRFFDAIEGKSPLCDIDGETGLSILRLQHEIIESVGQAMG